MDKPEPYAALSTVMQDLEAQGVPDVEIVDAAFRLALMGAARLYGPEAAHSLRDVAEMMEVCQLPEPSQALH
jgi:hypothetical protein